MFRGTINDLATRLNTTYIVASGIITFLKSKGLAKTDGEYRKDGHKGKGAIVFVFETPIVIDVPAGPITKLTKNNDTGTLFTQED